MSMISRLPALAACLTLLAVPAAAQAKAFKPVPSEGFRLQQHGLGPKAYKRVDALQKAYPRAGLEGVMGDLNRDITALPGGPVAGLRNVFGYGWKDTDNAVSYWVPQGITGSEDAGRPAGIQLVSWHHEGDTDVRIAFVDQSRRKYRFALLVQPAGGQRLTT